ncbi:MAG: oligosaccharide flippase family protein [Bacilli bacterium]|nr:oligosaccharide flippase family protein [Bacilli bacterium]
MKDNVRVNVIVNLIRTFVLTILSFVTFPWVCRALEDTVLGSYSWALTFVSYFLILAKIGIPNFAVRECVKVRDDKEKLSNKVQVLFILQGIATIGSFVIMSIIVFAVPDLHSKNITDMSALIFILSLNFLTGAFSFEWVFIALEKQFYMAVRSIVTLTISAMLIIIFVTNPSDVYIYAFISISVTITTSIANCIYITRFISFRKTMPYDFKQYAKPLAVLFTLTLTLSLYNQTDTFILGFIDKSKAAVGAYSVGIKGIDIIIGVLSNLGTVFIPRSAYYYSKEDKRFFKNLTKYSANICFFIVIPAIVTMIILAKPICSLISGNSDLTNNIDGGYNDSYLVLIALAMMMLTYSLGEIIYGQVLLPMKQEKYYLYALLVGVVINAFFSVLLGKFVFKDHPAIGVAIGTVTTDIAIFIFLAIKTWKWVKHALFNKNTLKLLLGGVLLALSSLLFYFVTPMIFKSLGAEWLYLIEIALVVVFGAIIYIISLLIMKEDLVYSFVRHRKGISNEA